MTRFVTTLVGMPASIAAYVLRRVCAVLSFVARGPGFFGYACARILSTAAFALMSIPLLLRVLFVTSKTGVLLTPVAVAVFLIVSAITNPYLKADLEYAHERSSAVQLVDRDGRWIGIIPPANFSDWSDGSILPPDHAAIPLVDIPPVWRTCMVFLEDREFDGVSRWVGVDPLAVLKSGWQTITFQRRRGASTLYMQVVRMLYSRSPEQDRTPGQVALRKLAELFGATALTKMLDVDDPQAAARFVGMHLPLVIGALHSSFGEPLYGIELASRILFGADANSLPPEDQAILAAAVKVPILLAPPGDVIGMKRAEVRWTRVKERAEYCLKNAFLDSASVDMDDARRRLARTKLPRPAIDPELAMLLPNDAKLAWRIVVNPIRRTLFFARYELSALRWELDQVVGAGWRGKIASVRLTTSATESHPFAETVVRILRHLQSTLPGLLLSLPPDKYGNDQADVVVACSDPNGLVRRIYSSRQDIFWNRKAPVGSIAKMLAAVALGRIDRPDTLYCPAPIPGIASSENGDPNICHQKGAWFPAREAFAHSSNKAIHWALRRLDHQTLQSVTERFGLPSLGDTPPATALTIGTFELTPAEMLRLAGSIGAGLTGAVVDFHNPSIIEQITMLDGDGKATIKTSQAATPLVRASEIRRMFSPRVKSFVSNVLQATSDENGTLRLLHKLREQLGGRLYAKTGTVSIAGSTQDLHIAGTYLRDGKPWSFVVTVGAPSADRPLGTRLVAGRLAPLVAAAVCGMDSNNPKLAHAN